MKESTATITLPSADILNKNELILKAKTLISNAGDKLEKKIEAINTICEGLIDKTATEQNLIINSLAQEFSIAKKIFNEQLNELKKAKKETEKNDELVKETIPQVTKIENFISKHFKVRYNEVSNKFEFKDVRAKNKDPEQKFEAMNEYNILRQLRKASFRVTSTELIETLKSDFTPKFNPFIEYFENLDPWDGEDYILKLSSYLIIEDKKRFDIQFRKLFVRMIACSLEISFNKQAFVFVGKGIKNQNMGKSTLIRWMIPGELSEYYTEEIPRDKDMLISLSENIIINLDELSTFNKLEINWLKSIMSKDTIKVRLPFDKRASVLKRRCNFMGSTNEAKFLTDLTGNVRWVAFYIKDIDFDYSKDIDINKVWAQAYHYFKNGINGKKFHWDLTRHEIEENEIANLEFMNLPPEMELIPRYYAPGTNKDNQAFYTATDFVKALTEKTNGSVKFYNNPIGKALRNLGFEQSSSRTEGSNESVKGYFVKFLTPDLQNFEKNNDPY